MTSVAGPSRPVDALPPPPTPTQRIKSFSLLRDLIAMINLTFAVARTLPRSIAARRFPAEEFLLQTWYTVKVCTLPALAVSIPFGVVLALQVAVLAQEVGATGFTGAGNTLAVVRQAAPMITALMLAGVAGSAICADLGSRRIREELDALEVMGIDVTERLVLPRVLATVTVSVLLNGIVMFFAIMTTLLVSVTIFNLSPGGYLASASLLTRPSDLALSLIKATVFAIICTVVAAYKGMTASKGPAGVSDAVTSAVVINFVLLFAANFAISQIHAQLTAAGL